MFYRDKDDFLYVFKYEKLEEKTDDKYRDYSKIKLIPGNKAEVTILKDSMSLNEMSEIVNAALDPLSETLETLRDHYGVDKSQFLKVSKIEGFSSLTELYEASLSD
jgi:hypothetical protein